jgi:micrococcal nuclease
VAVLVVLAAAACSGPTASDGEATVVEVVDGDTLVVRIAGQRETARLIGIDTPETKHPTKPVGCYGPEAAAQLAALTPPETRLVLHRDAEARDAYGRLLVYVFRASDGLFVNDSLVADGFADARSIEPNTTHDASLAATESRARAARAGMWGACRVVSRP